MYTRHVAAIALSLLGTVHSQQVGTNTPETHPSLPAQNCTAKGQCTTLNTAITLDSNWRWLHGVGGSTNCYTGNTWDATLCPDPAACASNCALDGADYSSTYGITTSGNALTLKFVTNGRYSKNIGSRVYLMASDDKYQIFSLLNQEFTFDIDVSELPCGLNGALYFASMDEDGGKSKYPTNKAGAKYGTGYCDAQCPQDIKFINGEANVIDWKPSDSDVNSGTGKYGTCCDEVDIWEANSMSTAFTVHPCTSEGQTRCEGTDCGEGDERYNGICDKDGCDFNPYRLGNTTFYGPNVTAAIDTSKKFTVVTQFITTDNTDSGDLAEVRRIYVQDGKIIQNSKIEVPGVDEVDSLTDGVCAAAKTAFDDNNDFKTKGGMSKVGTALKKGMVLVLSLWDDHAANMLWLDSTYPLDMESCEPGVSRGICSRDSGKPTDIEANSPNAQVTYSNIKFGALDSTY